MLVKVLHDRHVLCKCQKLSCIVTSGSENTLFCIEPHSTMYLPGGPLSFAYPHSPGEAIGSPYNFRRKNRVYSPPSGQKAGLSCPIHMPTLALGCRFQYHEVLGCRREDHSAAGLLNLGLWFQSSMDEF